MQITGRKDRTFSLDPEGHFRLDPPGSFTYHDPDMGTLYGEQDYLAMLAQSQAQADKQQTKPPKKKKKNGGARAQKEKRQTVVVGDPVNPAPKQQNRGAAAERTVFYYAASVDENGNFGSHDLDRSATITLHEKLDPKSKSKATIADPPQSEIGSFEDLQFVMGGGSFRVLRDWKVNGQSVGILDQQTHQTYAFEVTTYDANSSTPIKTEFTNTPPF